MAWRFLEDPALDEVVEHAEAAAGDEAAAPDNAMDLDDPTEPLVDPSDDEGTSDAKDSTTDDEASVNDGMEVD